MKAPGRARPGPEIAVVVASHERTLRLRWLLNALSEQTLARDRWEVVVAHDTSDPGTPRLLATHPVTARELAFAPGSGSPAQRRNAGWRASAAPLIAFTDDDCRPPPDWLERALAAAGANPGAIVQGATRPDPDERALMLAPRYRTQDIDPPTPHAQTCNILYPRELLERLGGFLEDAELIGEDTELAARARAAGAAQVAAPAMLTYHAVEAQSLPARARAAWRWRGLPRLVKLRPELREQAFVLRFFWKWSHVRFLVAAVGVALVRRRRAFLTLALPWAWKARLRRARSPLGLAVAIAELPGSAVVDASEVAALAAGSLRDRTLLL